jgi:hypothetical protein
MLQSKLMKTLKQAHSFSAVYYGDRPDWLIVTTQNRDSDCLTRSNFRSFLKILGGEGEHVEISRSSHWACGWVEYLTIDPSQAELIAKANAQHERLESYPVLDENDLSELELEEANETWKNCYDVAERVAYVRKYRSQFDFRDFADLLGCMRGNYFAGYASELLCR